MEIPEPTIFGKDERNKANFFVLGYKQKDGTVVGQIIQKTENYLPTSKEVLLAKKTYNTNCI